MKNNKVVICPHPYNPNLQIEMEVEEHEFELIEGKNTKPKKDKSKKKQAKESSPSSEKKTKKESKQRSTVQQSSKNQDDNDNNAPVPSPFTEKKTKLLSPVKESPKTKKKSPTQSLVIVRQSAPIVNKFQYVRDFVGILADAKATKAFFLLNSSVKAPDMTSFENNLRTVFNDETHGSIVRSFESLSFSLCSTITLKDIIKSKVTRNNFAIYCATMSRQQTGGSAQPGILYSNRGETAYNLHGGMQHRNETAKRIACLKMWFDGLNKNRTTGELYYVKTEKFNW
jgi:hypothetical protein